MLLDNDLNFDVVGTGQAITASAASTDVIDLGVANPNAGEGTPVNAVVTVTATFGSAASDETLTIAIQGSDDNGSSDAFASVSTREAIPIASLTGGARFYIPLPKEHERYVRLYYTVAGSGNFTAGTVHSYLAAQA
jgi:hypothetical protein